MSEPTQKPNAARFEIFRASQATDLAMDYAGLTDVDHAGIAQAREAGFGEGGLVRVLFAEPVTGMSLTYVWFKPNYVLPRHAHDADCLYYVVSGELHLGSEVLKAGDGFFLPRDNLYHYTAGPEGVEVLEFRNATVFNMQFTGNGEAAWRRIGAVAAANLETWRAQTPPPAAARILGLTGSPPSGV